MQESSGATALIRAASRGSVELGRILVAAGANPDIQDATGTTAIDVATSEGNFAFADMLRAAGARIVNVGPMRRFRRPLSSR